jgi:L-amino acid N-acyltransferase
MVQIRKARLDDIFRIREIYNEAVINTTATFDTEEKTQENRIEWFLNRDENFPVIVAEVKNEVIGYASLNRCSDKKAYEITAEISLYIDPLHRGKGIGKKLIDIIIKSAESDTALNSIIARITEGNDHSVYLHEINGFCKVGVLREAGKKFSKFLDVTIMQKMLRK